MNPIFGDNGFFGSEWRKYWREFYGAVVITPKNYIGGDIEAVKRQHSRLKQVIETVNGQLEEVFGLHFPQAKGKWGLLSRIASKVAALNVGIRLNRHFGRPYLALATLFNC